MSKELDKRVGLWHIQNSHYGVNPVYGKDNLKKTYLGMIKKVIFNDPATIVLWSDGSKTVVKCDPDDVFDPEKGLATACMKKLFGNKGYYNDIFRKWLSEKENEKSLYPKHPDDVFDAVRHATVGFVMDDIAKATLKEVVEREADKIYNKLLYGTEEGPAKKVNFKDIPSSYEKLAELPKDIPNCRKRG